MNLVFGQQVLIHILKLPLAFLEFMLMLAGHGVQQLCAWNIVPSGLSCPSQSIHAVLCLYLHRTLRSQLYLGCVFVAVCDPDHEGHADQDSSIGPPATNLVL